MKEFQKIIQLQFNKLQKTGKLFKVKLSGEDIWKLYINGFKPEDNPIFRDPASSEFNCNNCKNFIRRYSNVVAIIDSKVESIFSVDLDQVPEEYKNSCKAMNKAIISSSIDKVFFETFAELNSINYESCKKTNSVFRLGIAKNIKRYTKEESQKFGVVKPNEERTFHHFHLDVDKKFVDMSGKSIEAITGEYRVNKELLEKGMGVSTDTYELMCDLIQQNSLVDGLAELEKVKQYLQLSKEYTVASNKNNWLWEKSVELGNFSKFANSLIGTTCIELESGVDMETVCKTWNKRADPSNRYKTTAPIPTKLKEEAVAFIKESGLEVSFDRRFATIGDIDINQILHKGNTSTGKTASIFDSVPTTTSNATVDVSKLQSVTIEEFMKNILPNSSGVEVYLTSDHEKNLCSLTTSNRDAPQIFKWDNPFSTTFIKNLAGTSQIKQAVKMAGGNVDGVLNCRLAWNFDGNDHSDLDLWAYLDKGDNIGFNTGARKDNGNKFSSEDGQLDVDDRGYGHEMHVENIYFKTLTKLKSKKIKYFVNQYSAQNSKGFKAEIEFDGKTYSYSYNTPVRGNVNIAEVSEVDGKLEIKHFIEPDGMQTKELYGLDTNKFHKVNLVCLSPNYWGNNNIGNKYYLFMLENCKTTDPVRGFHIENLMPELLPHKRVLEVFGNITPIPHSENQLSGLGFNETVPGEVVVKVTTAEKKSKVLKVIF